MSDKWKNCNFLVVDPSDTTRKFLKHHLECQGAIVYTCGVTDKIASVIHGTNNSGMMIDVVLIDVRLPETYGLFALKALNAALAGRRIPIFVMSYGFPSLGIQQMKEYSVFGYLRKPFKIEDLDPFLILRMQKFKEQFGPESKTQDAA